MEIEFETQEELYKRVLPALRSKVRELKNIMHVDVVRLNAYIENNLKRTGIYQNKE